MIAELINKVFTARNVAHKEHWTTRSQAAHVALGAFYADVIEAIDALTENYIGMYGEIDFIPADKAEPQVKDIAGYLQDEADFIETNRMEISQGSESIGALVDNLVTVYTQTAFLLRMR